MSVSIVRGFLVSLGIRRFHGLFKTLFGRLQAFAGRWPIGIRIVLRVGERRRRADEEYDICDKEQELEVNVGKCSGN